MQSFDLVDMYLSLAEKYQMKFYFGLYDSGKYWIRVIYLGRLKIINTLLMKFGSNMVKSTRVLADGISVARSAVRLKELLMLSEQWENNARMSLLFCQFLQGFQRIGNNKVVDSGRLKMDSGLLRIIINFQFSMLN